MIKDEIELNLKQKSKNSEEKGRNSLSKDGKAFYLLFDNCPYPIFLLNKKGVIEDLNMAAVKLSGHNRDKAKGKAFIGLLTKDSRKSVSDKYNMLLKEGHINEELKLVFKNENNVNVTCSALPAGDDSDGDRKIVLFAHDTMELKEAQKAFDFKSNLLSSLLDNIPDHIYFKDRKSRFIQASKSVAEQFGVKSVVDLIGKTDFDYFTREHAELAYRDEQEIMKTGKPIEGKLEKETHPDGRITWVSTTKMPRYDEKGNIIGILGTSRDVTEKIKLEEKLKERLDKLGEEVVFKSNLLTSLLDNIPDLIYFKDRKSRFVELSKSKANQAGLPKEEVIGKTDFDYFTKEHAEQAYGDEQKIIKTGKPIAGKVEKETHPDGRTTWVSTTKIPRYDEKGNIIGTLGISRDVTEKIKLEEKLKERLDRLGEEVVLKSNLLTSLLDNIPDPIYFKDRNSRFIIVNKAKAMKAGKDEKFFIGKTDFDFFPKDQAKEMLKDEKQILEKGKKIIEKEQKVTRTGGKEEWTLATKVPRYDEKGNIIGTLGISRDITEKKTLEEKLKERVAELGEEVIFKSNLLTALLNNTPDHIYFKDKKSRFTAVSKSLAEWLGTGSPEDMIGKTDFDYFTKEHAEPAYKDEQNVMKTGKPIEGKAEKETYPDGRTNWVSTTKIPRYDEKGNAIGTLGISRDITDRLLAEKKLEETANKLQTIVNAVSEGLAIVGEDYVIREANDFLCKLFGLEREEIINKKCHEIFPPWEESCQDCPLKKMFDKSEISPVSEKTKVSKNGSIRYFSIQCYPIPNYDDKELKSVISISDITERKNMEKKNVQNYRRKMKKLSHKLTLAEEHERKRIATDLHADIGQTLAFLKLKIGELRGRNPSPNVDSSLKEVYDLVQNAITSARSLISQISPTILYELGFVPAVDWLAEHILKENGIKYDFSDDGKDKPLTDDIRILLFQAVRELLVNIRKHARARKVKIFIEKNKDNIQIEVKDDGIGFDISVLDSYCEKDIGFGLLNIRERIDIVGGSFEIESNKNKGTKITLKAPINI